MEDEGLAEATRAAGDSTGLASPGCRPGPSVQQSKEEDKSSPG